MTRKRQPIPYTVRHRPADTRGGEAWCLDLRPGADGKGFPVEFKRWEIAATFIVGLNHGKIDQSLFAV